LTKTFWLRLAAPIFTSLHDLGGNPHFLGEGPPEDIRKSFGYCQLGISEFIDYLADLYSAESYLAYSAAKRSGDAARTKKARDSHEAREAAVQRAQAELKRLKKQAEREAYEYARKKALGK
jgi:hypothetical protein